MTKKPGRWRNGHSSMHPQTRPPRLRRNDITWSSSSCVRGRGAACTALPPKASPHTTPPRQSKASQQFVSLRLHAAQSWAPPALQFHVQIHWCPAGAKAAFKQGPILSNRHDPKTRLWTFNSHSAPLSADTAPATKVHFDDTCTSGSSSLSCFCLPHPRLVRRSLFSLKQCNRPLLVLYHGCALRPRH